MLPLFAEALASIALRAVQSILPNTPQDKLELLRLQIEQQAQENTLLLGQLKVNEAEASNDNLFVAGWRPCVGWVCAASFAWQFVVMPILIFLGSTVGHTIPVPTFDISSMLTVLMGMLGLGALRSYDKKQGTK